ncbi:hypothetical protein TWF569_000342 [Orbilia oligospora]|uniref:Uncharacterized protein n=1 Tax=Orbilia oligospora TaxID=2813651 RepID=A0A7C8J9U4_ORBOL|nr:hypothetical protein TWF102_003203 [Orbilia oligospora]KAF3099317.1 hypothetical protein TWF103_008829 [Orbilia oligospora]KAF3116286.1 hypothetical protein TWF706_003936 [Orbilia oligospora]KAF3133800.1 hypothetical protein TWF594_008959 [Orbilia oligospora]KAF3154366.1 hypothetical protein TWF569_000342 [Orbilia oligospora]
MKFQIASIFGLLALSEAAVLDRRHNGCNHNDCLRALLRRNVVAAADCASYWPAPGGPSTTIVVVETATATEIVAVVETATETVTSTDTATNTDISTESSTEIQSFTHTDSQTSTDTAYDTATFTSDATVVGTTVGLTETTTVALPNVMIGKRQVTQPTYATACIDQAAYSSACSCLTLVESPITTINTATATFTSTDVVTSTATSSSTSISISTSTFTSTSTTTVTVTATVTGTISTTDTISPTVTTITNVVTDSSTTIANPVTTVTSTTLAPAVTWVAVYIVGRDNDANKANQYLKVDPTVVDPEGISRIVWTSNQAEAAKFFWNSATKQVKIDTAEGPRFICTQLVESDFVFVRIMSEALCTAYIAPKLRFALNPGNLYVLENTRFKSFGYRTDSDQLVIAKEVEPVKWAQYQAKEVFLKGVNALTEEIVPE